VPQLTGTLLPMDKPLPPLGVYVLGIAIELDKFNTGHDPGLDPGPPPWRRPTTT
jgi:hypothetical protein